MTDNDWSIDKLNKSVYKESFDCGYEQLNDFLKKYAKQSQKKSSTITYVALFNNDPKKRVLGYYSVSMASINYELVPEQMSKGLSKYHSVSAVHLTKLAVDKDFNSTSGKDLRIGEGLLMNVFKKTHELSERIGCCGVLVDASNEKAEGFYEKYGFEKMPKDGMQTTPMFLDIKSIKQLRLYP